jgi:hypothetical protein
MGSGDGVPATFPFYIPRSRLTFSSFWRHGAHTLRPRNHKKLEIKDSGNLRAERTSSRMTTAATFSSTATGGPIPMEHELFAAHREGTTWSKRKVTFRTARARS